VRRKNRSSHSWIEAELLRKLFRGVDGSLRVPYVRPGVGIDGEERAVTRAAAITASGFLLLSGVHVLLGFVYPDLPSWKMFGFVPRYRYELRDAQGKELFVHDHMPARAYALCDARYLISLAVWIANRQPERAPIDVRVTFLMSGAETTREFRALAGQSHADELTR